jgi:hypothetical protein
MWNSLPLLLLLSLLKLKPISSSTATALSRVDLTPQKTFELFKSAKESEWHSFNTIVKTQNMKSVQKWIAAVGNENKDLLLSFLFTLAVDEGKYNFASTILESIGDMKHLIHFKHLSLYRSMEAYLHDIQMNKKPSNKAEFESLVDKFYQKRFNIEHNAHSTDPSGLLSFINKDGKILELEMYSIARTGYCANDAELKAAITKRFYITTHMLLINWKSKLSDQEYDTKLSKLDLKTIGSTTSHVSQKMKVPLLHDIDSRPRSSGYLYLDQEIRAGLLNHIKLHSSPHDSKVYYDMYDGDISMTIREALAKNVEKLVENFFLRRNIGPYQPDWILFAIKFSKLECLEILLEERVPLPTDAELEAAYKFIASTDKTAKIAKIESFKKFYKDRICIHGPIGCKPETLNTEDSDDIDDLDFGDSDDIDDLDFGDSDDDAVINAPLDKNDPLFKSECNPLA